MKTTGFARARLTDDSRRSRSAPSTDVETRAGSTGSSLTATVSRVLRGTLSIAVLGLAGCAATDDASVPYDPYESWNRDVYAFNDSLDKAFLKPASELYDTVTPDLVQEFIFNFFDNLAYPGTIINNLLQGKLDESVSDLGRFVFNSTLGIGGFIDVSSGFGMPRHEEDFGQTLGVWGVEAGPYYEVPLFGPFDGRDLPTLLTSRLTDLSSYFPSPATYVMSGADLIDTRNRLDSLIKARDEQLDPYAFQRDGYRQRRRSQVYDGNPPLEDPVAEEAPKK
ncbi:MAG: VacJ family lipoprotein [Gammaproteobacteria bacterium]|nr:VacJ family lipoprotein [Gammaproteobacteria bacterium]